MNTNFARTISAFSREYILQSITKSPSCYLPTSKAFSSKTLGDACTIEDGGKSSLNPRYENRRVRRNLALAYRLLNRLELNEGVCNHLTAMAPCREDNTKQTMLVIPGKLYIGTKYGFNVFNPCYKFKFFKYIRCNIKLV